MDAATKKKLAGRVLVVAGGPNRRERRASMFGFRYPGKGFQQHLTSKRQVRMIMQEKGLIKRK